VNLTVRHRVRRGETLRVIAAEYAVNPTELARENNLGRGRPLRRGMLLTVPASFRAPRPEVLATEEDDPRASTDYVPERRIGLPGKVDGNSVPTDRATHVVNRGETLRSIADKYDLALNDLRAWNHVTTPGVKVGTLLVLKGAKDAGRTAAKAEKDRAAKKDKSKPASGSVDDGASKSRVVADAATLDEPAGGDKADAKVAKPAPDRVPASRTHTVRAGETLLDIARRHNVSADELRKLNGLRGGHVTPGQRLILPA